MVLLFRRPDRLGATCGGRYLGFNSVSLSDAFIPFTDKAGLDELNTTTGSSKCLALLKAWLDDRLLQHDKCLAYTNSGATPLLTRVIDVVAPGDDHDHVLLVTSNGRAAPYAALSHC